jgi:hypothetical protein
VAIGVCEFLKKNAMFRSLPSPTLPVPSIVY